ncbi:HEPN domain-containing protein [Rahnella sp. GSA61A]|jgi:hypothetical protein|uniref:HEPN domain-containing protein n=1 Tax=Rahnella sp. GSA61A TaxID=2862678 RepID=UPI001CC13EC6|nr:HEPN domain-containing protein [Rahnella sp. GSA61A]
MQPITDSRIRDTISSTPKLELASVSFNTYISRIYELESKFINEEILITKLQEDQYLSDPTIIFDQDMIRAFRLLCHAETEAYLENLADKLSKDEYLSWKADGTPSDVVINIIASHYSGWDKIDCSVKEYKPFSDQQIKKHGSGIALAAAEKAYGAYKHVLLNNHGVKEENFKNMFVPLGILEGDYNDLIQLLDRYGAMRGSVAHSSNTVQTLINPIDEKNVIIDIIKGILILDINVTDRLNNQGRAMLERINQMQMQMQMQLTQ